MQANLLNAAPRSLATNRVIAEPQSGVEQNFFTKALLQLGGFYSKESRLLRAAKAWYECVTEQVEDPRLYRGGPCLLLSPTTSIILLVDIKLAAAFGLEQNFAGKYAMLSIHMWLCLVRLRAEDQEGKQLAQILYENFTDDVEVRVRAAGVKVQACLLLCSCDIQCSCSCWHKWSFTTLTMSAHLRCVRLQVRISKHLTDLEQMFYGSSLSYDQVMSFIPCSGAVACSSHDIACVNLECSRAWR